MRELEARDQAERDAGLPSAQRMRALVPEAGRFISMFIRACNFRRILEIGTSYGYSTLWLASAAQATGGHVETLELSPERFNAAHANLERAGLSGARIPAAGRCQAAAARADRPIRFYLY